ncbi:MAG: hypothetical protein WC405_18200 [Syntrophales bacterium]
MVKKETVQKEISAKLKEWSRIIDELRAQGEKKLRSDSENLVAHCAKIHKIHHKYLEARQELEELAKTDDATWEKHRANIQRIMDELNRLWQTLF